jgi:hypothetical protein
LQQNKQGPEITGFDVVPGQTLKNHPRKRPPGGRTCANS